MSDPHDGDGWDNDWGPGVTGFWGPFDDEESTPLEWWERHQVKIYIGIVLVAMFILLVLGL
jgi:hypothetical protein